MFLVFNLISKIQDLSSNLRVQEGKPDQGLSTIQREESVLLFCPTETLSQTDPVYVRKY